MHLIKKISLPSLAQTQSTEEHFGLIVASCDPTAFSSSHEQQMQDHQSNQCISDFQWCKLGLGVSWGTTAKIQEEYTTINNTLLLEKTLRNTWWKRGRGGLKSEEYRKYEIHHLIRKTGRKLTSDKKSSIDNPPIAFRSAESLYGASFQGLAFQIKNVA